MLNKLDEISGRISIAAAYTSLIDGIARAIEFISNSVAATSKVISLAISNSCLSCTYLLLKEV